MSDVVMNNISEAPNSDNTIYTVFGFRTEFNDDNEAVIITEIIGNFTNLESALICVDIHKDLDTTLDNISITTGKILEELPELEVMLKIDFDNDNLLLRSQAVPLDTSPWIREEENIFEALACKEDKKEIIEYATQWYKNKYNSKPHIINNTASLFE